MPKLKVQLRGGYSDRNKIKPENTFIQTTDFDERTRIALINTTNIVCNGAFNNFDYIYNNDGQRFVKHVLAEVYGAVLDWSRTYDPQTALNAIYSTIKEDDYDSVLTVIEYIVQKVDLDSYGRVRYEKQFYTATALYNATFEKEYVGYRIVNRRIMPITDINEIEEIEAVANCRYSEVRAHIEKAIGFLSDRETPDYANSIKESISAVERMCSVIVGQATTLGEALKKLQSVGVDIHPALKGAFEKLYGYTSDGSGIRHSGQLGGADATFEEAKFMMVSCCAFVNYLVGVSAKQSAPKGKIKTFLHL